jgi:4-hydroxyphenylpyruvate dioxygenase
MSVAETTASRPDHAPRHPLTRPRTGIATVCLSGTLEDKLAAAAAAGFDGVEIFENDLIASPASPGRVRQQCADLGLSVDLYQPFRDFEAVPPQVFAANLRRAERKFDVMERLGAPMVLVCSSVSPESVDDDDLAAEQLHTLASRAAERGLRVAYEALAWGRSVHTYQHAWEIVRRADHPALGVCLDSFHVLSRDSDPAGIRDIPGDKVFFLQLADAPRLEMDVLQWSRHHRLFPGQGAFDLTAFLGHVLATGYQGPWSLEVFNDVFRQADPWRAGVDAMRSLLFLGESMTVPKPAMPTPAVAASRVPAPDLPAAPELAGHAFTELAVDEVSGPEVERALAAMGFAHTGQHRSKPVQLWQQGGARVLLNATGR